MNNIVLVAIHLLVGISLIFLTQLLRWLMDDQIAANLLSFHGLSPLVPCIGLGWMLVGTRLLTRRHRWYVVTRIIHLCWLRLYACIAVLGVAMIGFEVLTLNLNGEPYIGMGAICFLGAFLVVASALMSARSYGIVWLLRPLIGDAASVQPQEQVGWPRLANVLAAFSVLLCPLSVGWLSYDEHQRQEAFEELHEQQSRTRAYDGGVVKYLEFSPNGDYVATAIDSAASFRSVRLWDIASGKFRQTWDGSFEVLSVAFTPDSTRLIVCFEDQWNSGGFIIFDVEKWTEKPEYGYVSAAFSANGSRLAVRRLQAIEIWSFPLDATSTMLYSWVPRLSTDDADAITFCDEDTKIAAIGSSEAKVWNLSPLNHVPNDTVLYSTVGGQTTGAFSEDRSRLVVAEQDQVKVIDLKTETLSREFKAPFEVVGLTIASDNARIAAGGQGRVAILDAKTGAVIKELAQRD